MQVEMLKETHQVCELKPGQTFILDGEVYLFVESYLHEDYRAANLKTGVIRTLGSSHRILPASYKAIPVIRD